MEIQLSDHFTYGRLIRFTIPSIAMMIFTSIYGVMDGFFVSNYVGSTPFAAQNLILPFIMMLSTVGFMVGTGGSALIAMTFGMGRDREANEIFTLLVCLLFGVGVVAAVLGAVLTEPVAVFLGASEEMLPYCSIYSKISMISLPFFMLQSSFQSFMITAERPQIGFYITAGAGAVNMILDWLFMGVLHLGLGSAAAATVIGEFIGGGVPLIYFALPNRSLLHLRLSAPDPGKVHIYLSHILKVVSNGFSEFMSNVSMSVISMLYNFQLMRYAGQNGVAAYGIIMYTNFVFIAVFLGYSQGAAPIVSYHHGAENRQELSNVFRRSMVLICGSAVVMTVLAELFAGGMAMIFAGHDRTLMQMAAKAIRIYSASYLAIGFNIFGSAFFTALNNGKISALISFMRVLVFQVLAVMLLPLVYGLRGIWFSIVTAEVLACLVTFGCLLKYRQKYGYWGSSL